MSLDKIEKQIIKKKAKKKQKRLRATAAKTKMLRYEEADGTATGEIEHESDSPTVRIQNIEYKPMDVDEAVLQMDLIRNSFLVFTNAQTERVNVLYRLKDGNYGLIQPSS